MAKIIDITPPSKEVKPVLMILTSHRMDCFLLCVKCLELYTDINRFKKIYVLANDVGDDHAVIIKAFQKRHKNVIDIHMTPRGMVPGVLAMQNFILTRHLDDVVIKMDEDVFVTPHWLDHMLATYKIHKKYDKIPLVSCLMPVTRTGRQCMARLLRKHYPKENARLPDTPVEKNAVYHRFIWEKVLFDGLMEKHFSLDKPRHYYLKYVSANCVLFDHRLARLLISMPVKSLGGTCREDEFHINAALAAHNMKSVIISGAVVHHFAHARAEKYLRGHVSLDDVWWHMTCLDESPAYHGKNTYYSPVKLNASKREVCKLMRERALRIL